MPNSTPEELANLLRSCGDTAPEPLYPREFAERTGVARERLEPGLEELRLSGFLRLTDWVAGRGQGYALTPSGIRALKQSAELERVLTNGGPAKPPPEPRPRERRRPARGVQSRGAAIAQAMTTPEPPRATFLLILMNVLVFVAGLYLAPQYGVSQSVYLGGGGDGGIEGYGSLLRHLGAITATDVLHGQWWRLLTCCFVHVGFLHILMNMLSLYFIGPLMERAYGTGRYVVLYLLTGIVGSVFGVLLHPGVQLAGASGALCGLLGALGSWAMVNRRYLPHAVWLSWMRAVAINAVLIVYISTWRNVSWQAHLGGGVSGLLVGALLTYHRWGSAWQRWAAVVGLALVPVACAAAIWEAPRYSSKWELAREELDAEDLSPEARADFKRLKETVLPETDVIAANAEKVCVSMYQKVRESGGPLDKELVSGYRQVLEQTRKEGEYAADQLAGVGRLHGAAEVARKTRRAEFRQVARLSDLLIQCLDAGESCSSEERDELRDQYNELADLHNRWLNLRKALES